jgi:hypothetical protein
MSLRNQHKEIQRLISGFAFEADNFHDISLSTFFVAHGDSTDRSFSSPQFDIAEMAGRHRAATRME